MYKHTNTHTHSYILHTSTHMHIHAHNHRLIHYFICCFKTKMKMWKIRILIYLKIPTTEVECTQMLDYMNITVSLFGATCLYINPGLVIWYWVKLFIQISGSSLSIGKALWFIPSMLVCIFMGHLSSSCLGSKIVEIACEKFLYDFLKIHFHKIVSAPLALIIFPFLICSGSKVQEFLCRCISWDEHSTIICS